ncbi:hypothetical protein HPB48_003229 [Haemaphysalis longicornis]|uniref:CCHC-type domain-containing protein n=1 Tax=Haemaphysalis longicornis TaxID=44386 RepID=A0A9J6FVD9_HAELO|nr:hypothetical protein HPB48_003229 [Haemaphysalis longicornis]
MEYFKCHKLGHFVRQCSQHGICGERRDGDFGLSGGVRVGDGYSGRIHYKLHTKCHTSATGQETLQGNAMMLRTGVEAATGLATSPRTASTDQGEIFCYNCGKMGYIASEYND